MAQLQKYQDDFILLLESGFIAAGQTDEDAALKLFRAAELLKPEHILPKVGYGYVHLLKLELNQARKRFEDVLKIDPENEMARAMLGLSIALTVKEADKGEKLLEQALKKSGDEGVKGMASTAIEFIEKFVKKQPTPVEGESKKNPEKKGTHGSS